MGAMCWVSRRFSACAEYVEPGEPLGAATEVEFRVAVIEIAVGQEQATEAVGSFAFKIG